MHPDVGILFPKFLYLLIFVHCKNGSFIPILCLLLTRILLWHNLAASSARTFLHSLMQWTLSKAFENPRITPHPDHCHKHHMLTPSNSCARCNFSLQNSSLYVSYYLLVSIGLPIREVRFTHPQLVDHHEPFKNWHCTCPLLFLRYSGLVACNFILELT